MLFLVGPRQVGKTTLGLSAKALGKDFFYLNFDILEDRHILQELDMFGNQLMENC
jgi:predicted AAA+ superfamily ATPase